MAGSPARGKLLPDDAVLAISYAGGADPLVNPSAKDSDRAIEQGGIERAESRDEACCAMGAKWS
jgi:hypothetical protein